jgi:hypothetical protein
MPKGPPDRPPQLTASPQAALSVPLRIFFSMRSRCSRLMLGGGAHDDGKCLARHFAQSIGSGVVGSPIVSFQRVNGMGASKNSSFSRAVRI